MAGASALSSSLRPCAARIAPQASTAPGTVTAWIESGAIVSMCCLQHRQGALAEVGPVLLLRAELLQLDPGPLGQELQRPPLVGLLDQLDEREDVPLPLTAEAVPRLPLRIHVEAGAVLLVERAQAPVVLVPLREGHVLLDDLDQVDLGLDLREGVIGRQGGHGAYCDAERRAEPPCALTAGTCRLEGEGAAGHDGD